uniref:Uncharacterized protein n=2 Tax=Salix TaxID=40685 RepID=A0A6N2NKM9_SALVM
MVKIRAVAGFGKKYPDLIGSVSALSHARKLCILRAELGVKRKRGDCGRLREKKLLKKLSIVQDLADELMASADIPDGRGQFPGPLLVSCAGLLSALISTHKNWVSC